jgi:high affinity Mn2+ porin
MRDGRHRPCRDARAYAPAKPPQIAETYYAVGITKGITLTLDYQFIQNPAYNADRGPASIISARLHSEF